MKKMLFAAVALAMPIAAPAATFVFSYGGQGGAPTGSGTITTSDTLNAVGGFDITGITGTFAGNAITGLLANPNQPNPSGASFTWDNVLLPSNPIVFRRYGIGFLTGTTAFNIFDAAADGQSPPSGFPYGLLDNQGSRISFGTFDIQAAVPEPATWALLILGFGAIGASLRYRKGRTSVTFG